MTLSPNQNRALWMLVDMLIDQDTVNYKMFLRRTSNITLGALISNGFIVVYNKNVTLTWEGSMYLLKLMVRSPIRNDLLGNVYNYQRNN